MPADFKGRAERHARSELWDRELVVILDLDEM